MNAAVRTLTIALLAGVAAPAAGQSLFLQPAGVPGEETPAITPSLPAASMFFVAPTQPRAFSVHDIVHVIINETSSASSSQTLETTKEATLENRLENVIDPMLLLELQLRAAATSELDLLNLEASNEFAGEGAYDRQDRLTARVAAEVVDIKPNGTVILRARKTIGTDEERRTITLTGTARSEDITDANTVLSSQLADLVVDVDNEGEVRKGAKKGVITKALEFLFNF